VTASVTISSSAVFMKNKEVFTWLKIVLNYSHFDYVRQSQKISSNKNTAKRKMLYLSNTRV
jgi:hypothetical protein